MVDHHSWTSLDGSIQLHVNSGERSFKLRNLQDSIHPEDSHVTCQGVVREERDMLQVVTYVKSGCDSGFMCSLFTRQADNVIKVQFGHKSRIPREACSDLYFSPAVSRSLLLVSARTTSVSDSACPLSGRYILSPHAPLPWLHCSPATPPSALQLSSGGGSSALLLQHHCSPADSPSKTEYSCHASWQGPGKRTNVIISSNRRDFLCLSYTESQGLLSSQDCYTTSPSLHHSTFNISLAGPCVQALSAVSLSVCPLPPGLVHLLALVSLLSGLARHCQ